jgi:hypothetical protein
MKTPSMLHPTGKQARLRRHSAGSLLRRAGFRGRPKPASTHGSRLGKALPRITAGAAGRMTRRGR